MTVGAKKGKSSRNGASATDRPKVESQVAVAGVQHILVIASVQLGLIELELMRAKSLLQESPDREAMEEGTIPADVPTALQELLECALEDEIRPLRQSLEEGAGLTEVKLEQHWRSKRSLGADRAAGSEGGPATD